MVLRDKLHRRTSAALSETGDSEVQIVVKGRHVEITDEVRDYIREKAGKITRFYDRIHEIEVILDHESEQITCEMVVRVDHKNTVIGKAAGPDTLSLIDLVVEKIERQVVKHKEKNRTRKGGVSADGTSAST
jgi:putative sigma-54 modulation protein